MTGRNPDGIEDFPSPGCSDVAYGPQRPNALIGAERQALAPEAAWHTLSAEEVLRAEEADPRHGLSSAEAASRACGSAPTRSPQAGQSLAGARSSASTPTPCRSSC